MDPMSWARDAAGVARRAESTARNAAEYLRHGGLRIEPQWSPYEVVAEAPMYRLRRYFPDEIPQGLPALVLVPPLMMVADVYDVAPRSSAVRAVHENGVDVWVVDFGRPEEEPGGMQRTVADHVLAVSEVVDHVRRITGRDVTLSGYSQGGLFSYQATAYRRNDGVDSIVAFGTPIDFHAAALPTPIVPVSAQSYAHAARGALQTGVLPHVALPRWLVRTGSRMTDPVRIAKFEWQYFTQLHDRERLLPGEQQRQFLAWNGLTDYPGSALQGLAELVAENRLLTGGLVVGDRTISLSDIERPILLVLGEQDREGNPLSARAIRRAAPDADIHELTLTSGHFGLVAGSGARRNSWPRVAAWLRWRNGDGELPDVIVPADAVTSTRTWAPGSTAQRAQTIVDLGIGISHSAVRAIGVSASLAQSVVRAGAGQLPLINRLDMLRPATATSRGFLVHAAAHRDPDGIALMYRDRVIRHRELDQRVDEVVDALVSLGVRPGDRVGVLTESGPAGLSVIAATSRIGATAVLLRPEGDVALEAELGGVDVVVSDPAHAQRSDLVPHARWGVLGAGRSELPSHVVDLDSIDVAAVAIPGRPNPRRGEDPALVVFTESGEQTQAYLLTNRDWASTAFGVAGGIRLSRNDTVYATTPLHDPTTLPMAVGAALAVGARLALPAETDRETFWREVRRYGATHVSYASSSLADVVDGPRHSHEDHHPIQVLFGCEIPPDLQRRVDERFAPARVVDFSSPLH